MATRFYCRHSAETTIISPTPDAAWEDQTAFLRAYTRTSRIGNAMADQAFADADATDRDVLMRQYISMELVAGQTITGAQALKAQIRMSERAATCNMFFAIGIRVLASNGTTVRKTVLVVTRDNSEAAAALTNRQFTATSAATNYTVLAGDRLVFEIGGGGDPAAGSDHDYTLRLGDAAASDLPEDNTDTNDFNPWIELTDTLAFVADPPRRMLVFDAVHRANTY